jgi:hypothetical protein
VSAAAGATRAATAATAAMKNTIRTRVRMILHSPDDYERVSQRPGLSSRRDVDAHSDKEVTPLAQQGEAMRGGPQPALLSERSGGQTLWSETKRPR